MYRKCLAVLALLMPAFGMLAATGCAEKTVVVQETEQRHESEPKMTSPGQEVVE